MSNKNQAKPTGNRKEERKPRVDICNKQLILSKTVTKFKGHVFLKVAKEDSEKKFYEETAIKCKSYFERVLVKYFSTKC